MPKYILSPDGSIVKLESGLFVSFKRREGILPSRSLSASISTTETSQISGSQIGEQISSVYMSHAGSFYDDKNPGEDSIAADVNLVGLLEQAGSEGGLGIDVGSKDKNNIWDHTIGQTNSPTKDGTNFPVREDTNFLINPSFGADQPQTYYKNFSSQKDIFASESEIMAGLDFHSGGFKDLTRFTFVVDYLLEAISYIGVIEGILAAEDLGGKGDSASDIENNYQMELGNYGSVSYTAITRFIYEVLQYPKDKSSSGTLDRLGAFFVGLSLYLNSDPNIFLKKF